MFFRSKDVFARYLDNSCLVLPLDSNRCELFAFLNSRDVPGLAILITHLSSEVEIKIDESSMHEDALMCLCTLVTVLKYLSCPFEQLVEPFPISSSHSHRGPRSKICHWQSCPKVTAPRETWLFYGLRRMTETLYKLICVEILVFMSALEDLLGCVGNLVGVICQAIYYY